MSVPSSIIQDSQKLFNEIIIFKMPSFQYKITMHAKNQECMAIYQEEKINRDYPQINMPRQGTKK